MKIDYIVKQELWRSVAVYWGSFFVIGFLIVSGYLPLPAFLLFPLALVPTTAHFLIMVWYRRKEQLANPTITNALLYALRRGEHGEGEKQQGKVIIEKVVDAVLAVAIFLIYLYASLAGSINQVFWLPVLVIISLLLARIVFIDGRERRVTLARSVVFYLIAAAIVVLRYLALGYPVVPLLQAIALVGIVSFPILYIWERRSAPKGKD